MNSEEKPFPYPIAVNRTMDEVFSNNYGHSFTVSHICNENTGRFEKLSICFEYEDVLVNYFFYGCTSDAACISMEISAEKEDKTNAIMLELNDIFIALEQGFAWKILVDKQLFTITLKDEPGKTIFIITAKSIPEPPLLNVKNFHLGYPN